MASEPTFSTGRAAQIIEAEYGCPITTQTIRNAIARGELQVDHRRGPQRHARIAESELRRWARRYTGNEPAKLQNCQPP